MYSFKCLYCNNEFQSIRNGRKFCSSKCSYDFYHKKNKIHFRENRKCKFCGNEFKAKQKRTEFCSNKCYGNYRYSEVKNNNRIGHNRICKNCGKDFVSHRVDKIFCSSDCQWNYRYKEKVKKHIEIQCIKCGKKFIKKTSSQKYCSRKCRFQQISSNEYERNKWYPKQTRREDGSYVSEHRYNMEKILNRKLSGKEHVHHIDCDKENNEINNLHLFKNNTEHGFCHGSLNKLVKILLDKNIIKFDKENGNYEMI